MASSADLVGNVTIVVTFLAGPGGIVTDGMKCGALDGLVYDCDDYCDGSPGYWNDDEPGDCGCCPDGMLLADPVSVVTNEMTFQERCDVLSGSVYDYDDYCDDSPDYFYYDEPGEFNACPDIYGFIGPDKYELYRCFHGLDDCGAYCVSRRDGGVIWNWYWGQ